MTPQILHTTSKYSFIRCPSPCPVFFSLSLCLFNPLFSVCGNYSVLKTQSCLPLCFNKLSCYHHPQSLASRHAIDTQTECFKTTCLKLIHTIEQRYRLDQEVLMSTQQFRNKGRTVIVCRVHDDCFQTENREQFID